jgi:hypothetical protein
MIIECDFSSENEKLYLHGIYTLNIYNKHTTRV